jgi:hypothetical protein
MGSNMGEPCRAHGSCLSYKARDEILSTRTLLRQGVAMVDRLVIGSEVSDHRSELIMALADASLAAHRALVRLAEVDQFLADTDVPEAGEIDVDKGDGDVSLQPVGEMDRPGDISDVRRGAMSTLTGSVEGRREGAVFSLPVRDPSELSNHRHGNALLGPDDAQREHLRPELQSDGGVTRVTTRPERHPGSEWRSLCATTADPEGSESDEQQIKPPLAPPRPSAPVRTIAREDDTVGRALQLALITTQLEIAWHSGMIGAETAMRHLHTALAQAASQNSRAQRRS